MKETIEQQKMKTLEFKTDPTFAELWDICVHNLLYDKYAYKEDIENLFGELSITKDSEILDVSAGGGFPSIDLIQDGYRVHCLDAMQDQIDVFEQKAKALGLSYDYKKGFWEEIPNIYNKNSFDFLFCRGNSFIYATHGWNNEVPVSKEESLNKYKEILKVFYDSLKDGGYLYIDKFKDSETSHKETVAKIQVEGKDEEDLIFWTERFPEQDIRRASMLRKDKDGNEEGLPNVTYDLKEDDVERLMQEVGFKNIKRLNLNSESHFVIWIAQK